MIGRRRILTVSISTKNGLSQAGAPLGSRDAAVELGEKIAPERINLSQSGSPILIEKRR